MNYFQNKRYLITFKNVRLVSNESSKLELLEDEDDLILMNVYLGNSVAILEDDDVYKFLTNIKNG